MNTSFSISNHILRVIIKPNISEVRRKTKKPCALLITHVGESGEIFWICPSCKKAFPYDIEESLYTVADKAFP